MLTITNEDNMELMARYQDKYFELAIVDPNYSETFTTNACKSNRGKKGKYKVSNLNKKTPNEYFNELFRVSKNQIIWGANWYGKYFGIGGIVWDKKILETILLVNMLSNLLIIILIFFLLDGME